MELDVRCWNLILPATLLACACGPDQIPLDDGGTQESGESSTSSDTGTTGGETAGETGGDDGSQTSGDDGYGYGADCELDEYPNYSGLFCYGLDDLDPCNIPTSSIPLAEVGSGYIVAANLLDGPGQEVMHISEHTVTLVSDAKGDMAWLRPIGGGLPMAAVVADFDGDDEPEIIVSDDNDSAMMLQFEGDELVETELPIPTSTELLAANLVGDETPELLVAAPNEERDVTIYNSDFQIIETEVDPAFPTATLRGLVGAWHVVAEPGFELVVAANARYVHQVDGVPTVKGSTKISHIWTEHQRSAHGSERAVHLMSDGAVTRLQLHGPDQPYDPFRLDGNYTSDAAVMSDRYIVVSNDLQSQLLDTTVECRDTVELVGQHVALDFDGDGESELATLDAAGTLHITKLE